jgi:hypothetical protein
LLGCEPLPRPPLPDVAQLEGHEERVVVGLGAALFAGLAELPSSEDAEVDEGEGDGEEE